jgi:hypothetical protein
LRDQQLIRPGGSERAGHEVACEHDRVRLRPPPTLASGERLKVCRRRQTGDTLAVDLPPEPEPHSAATRGTPCVPRGSASISRIDGRERHFREGVPPAKTAAARESRSRSMRSTRFSLRRRTSSSDATPGSLPASTRCRDPCGRDPPYRRRDRRRARPPDDGTPPDKQQADPSLSAHNAPTGLNGLPGGRNSSPPRGRHLR